MQTVENSRTFLAMINGRQLEKTYGGLVFVHGNCNMIIIWKDNKDGKVLKYVQWRNG